MGEQRDEAGKQLWMAGYIFVVYREELFLEPFRIRFIVFLMFLEVALDGLCQVFGERNS